MNIHSTKYFVKCWSRVGLQACHELRVFSSRGRDVLHPPFLGVSVFDRCFIISSLALPTVLQIVLFLWLIKCCTKCSRWWWTMSLSFQCTEIFKLVCTWNQTRLVIFFPLSCHKLTVKMNKDGAASIDHHLSGEIQQNRWGNRPPPIFLMENC